MANLPIRKVVGRVSRFAKIARYESLTTTNAVASSSYAYDTAGRITSLQHASGATSLAGYTFTWDTADRLTSITQSGSTVPVETSTFSYDATNQLTAADHSGQSDEAFVYDANGNRIGTAVTVTAHNRILNDGTSTYQYDAEGNRTSKTDNATGAKVEYSWNHANQLTAVVYKASNNAVTKSVAYRYDALGRRISKSVDDTGNGSMDRSEHFLYDGAGLLASSATGSAIHISGPNGNLGQHGWTDQMILSFTDSDGEGPNSSILTSRSLYGPATDQIFATEVATGDLLWSLTDHLGTPRDWADRNATTGTTTIALHTRYTAFGSIESITDATGAPTTLPTTTLPTFTGQLSDPDTDLLYYRARWYDPTLGKFLSDDPMSFAAGDPNVSRYVGNRATTASDPDQPPFSVPGVMRVLVGGFRCASGAQERAER